MNNISNNTPAVIYIFGGTGDLSRRKLIPALYNLYLGGWLHENFSIVCIGTSIANRETLVKNLKSGVDEFSRSGKTKKATATRSCTACIPQRRKKHAPNDLHFS